jgi:hypothetical protein
MVIYFFVWSSTCFGSLFVKEVICSGAIGVVLVLTNTFCSFTKTHGVSPGTSSQLLRTPRTGDAFY